MAESRSREKIRHDAHAGQEREESADRGLRRTDYRAGADGTQHVDASEAEAGDTPQDNLAGEKRTEDEVHHG